MGLQQVSGWGMGLQQVSGVRGGAAAGARFEGWGCSSFQGWEWNYSSQFHDLGGRGGKLCVTCLSLSSCIELMNWWDILPPTP